MMRYCICSFGDKFTRALQFFIKDIRLVFKLDELGLEIEQIALPAALALTADPIASLIDTAFVGQIGPVELAAVGVSIAIFNQVSKIAIFPLVSITTTIVAEEAACKISAKEENENLEKGLLINSEMKELAPRAENSEEEVTDPLLSVGLHNKTNFGIESRHMSSVSSVLVIGGVLGFLQAMFLILAAKPALNLMGVKSDSPMLNPALQYLTLRSLGAPAVLLSLAMQGVFRGFKDTKTPLYATVAGDLTNIILDPIFMFVFHLDVKGAAIAHVISQYVISLILLLRLKTQVKIIPPNFKDLHFSPFLKNGFLLLWRVIAATLCVTLAASMAARMGPIIMSAFQICLQVWLATSLLADGLAVAGQAVLATAFAKKDFDKVVATTSRVLQLGLVLGLFLSIVIGMGLQLGSRLFTKDVDVLHYIHIGIPFVVATQPINSLAFVFDGINFGASDFGYSAYSMILVALASIFCLGFFSINFGFVGIWIALSIYMSLRVFAGLCRIGTMTGPWTFLRC